MEIARYPPFPPRTAPAAFAEKLVAVGYRPNGACFAHRLLKEYFLVHALHDPVQVGAHTAHQHMHPPRLDAQEERLQLGDGSGGIEPVDRRYAQDHRVGHGLWGTATVATVRPAIVSDAHREGDSAAGSRKPERRGTDD